LTPWSYKHMLVAMNEERKKERTGYAPLNVLIPVPLMERLKERAVREGVPASRLVREALRRYLEAKEKEVE